MTASAKRTSTNRPTNGRICFGTSYSEVGKKHVPQEQIQRVKDALRQFRKEAVECKKQIQNGALSTTQFISWMIAQEPIIQEICSK